MSGEPLIIRVPAASLDDVDGEPNHDGIYLDGLVPAMLAMNKPSDAMNAWTANPHLTETQTTLGLCGLAHLEVLNGGVEQLVYNGDRLAFDVPAALRKLGRDHEANLADQTVKAAWTACEASGDLTYVDSPEFERQEAELVDFLQSRVFYDLVAEAMKSDPVGYLIEGGK